MRTSFISLPVLAASAAGCGKDGKWTLVGHLPWQSKSGSLVMNENDGEAVIAHIKANMKNEHPTLLCYKPSEPRKIEIKGGK